MPPTKSIHVIKSVSCRSIRPAATLPTFARSKPSRRSADHESTVIRNAPLPTVRLRVQIAGDDVVSGAKFKEKVYERLYLSGAGLREPAPGRRAMDISARITEGRVQRRNLALCHQN